jgi:hypothetical protein
MADTLIAMPVPLRNNFTYLQVLLGSPVCDLIL